MQIPAISDIKKAHQRISSFAHHTPVVTNKQLDGRTGAHIFLKCENFQKVGAFKFRGACNAILSLSDDNIINGVATHSSGNHAQAVALGAKIKGIPAHIVMPEDAPVVKKKAVKGYDAHITFCESTQKAREAKLAQIVDETGATFVPPYDDPTIIAGQGTATLELLQDHPDLDFILAPVGGGGLLSGTAIAAKAIQPNIKIIGCEPEQADDAFRSFQSGQLQSLKKPDTIADGLRTSLSKLTFSCIQPYVDDIVTVSESAIIEAMRFIWERMNIIIEASSAVPIAALFQERIHATGKKGGIIITGGNVDLDHLPWQ